MTGKPAFRRFVLAALLLFAAAAGGGFLFTANIPFSAKQLEEWKTSPCLTDRAGEVFSVFLSEDSEWSLPVPLAGMGKWIPLVALEVEDRRFRQHPGVDPRALLRPSSETSGQDGSYRVPPPSRASSSLCLLRALLSAP